MDKKLKKIQFFYLSITIVFILFIVLIGLILIIISINFSHVIPVNEPE